MHRPLPPPGKALSLACYGFRSWRFGGESLAPGRSLGSDGADLPRFALHPVSHFVRATRSQPRAARVCIRCRPAHGVVNVLCGVSLRHGKPRSMAVALTLHGRLPTEIEMAESQLTFSHFCKILSGVYLPAVILSRVLTALSTLMVPSTTFP